jgi:hypothetical protein
LADEMAGLFTPPDLIPGCEVLDITDRNLYAANNGWIEARVGQHNQQRCRWKGQIGNVQVGDFVDVLYFASYRLFVVYSQGGTGAIAGYVLTSDYEDSDVLAKVKNVDGAASGLDADLLDGNEAAAFAVAGHSHSAPAASAISVDTTNFDGNLSASENTVQLALDHLDDLSISGLLLQFFVTAASDIGGYKAMTEAHPTGSKQTVSASITGANTVIEEFASASVGLGLDYLTDGVYHVHCHAAKTGGTKVASLFARIYRRTSGGTETLIATTDAIVSVGAVETEYDMEVAIAEVDLDLTDRLVVKILSSPSGVGSDPTVAIYYDGVTYSRLEFPGQLVMTADSILTKIKTVDGTGSGLDADLLDGNHASAFATTALDSGKVSQLWESDGGAVAWQTDTAGQLTGNSTRDIFPQASANGLNARLENLFGDDKPANSYGFTRRNFKVNAFTSDIAGYQDSQSSPYSYGGSPGGFSLTVGANCGALSSTRLHWLRIYNYDASATVYNQWTASGAKTRQETLVSLSPYTSASDVLVSELRFWDVQAPGGSDKYWAIRWIWYGSTRTQFPFQVSVWYGTGTTFTTTNGSKTAETPWVPGLDYYVIAALSAGGTFSYLIYVSDGALVTNGGPAVAGYPSNFKTVRHYVFPQYHEAYIDEVIIT